MKNLLNLVMLFTLSTTFCTEQEIKDTLLNNLYEKRDREIKKINEEEREAIAYYSQAIMNSYGIVNIPASSILSLYMPDSLTRDEKINLLDCRHELRATLNYIQENALDQKARCLVGYILNKAKLNEALQILESVNSYLAN